MLNRIYKFGDKYYLLYSNRSNAYNETDIIMGNWNDPNLYGYFNLLPYNSLNEVSNNSKGMSNIFWDQIVLWHSEIYRELKKNVEKSLGGCDISSFLLDSRSLKRTFFHKLMIKKDKFNLLFDLSDIITFKIICKKDLFNDIVAMISNNYFFNIKYKKQYPQYMEFIGITSLGTSYKILLTVQ